MLLSAAFFRRIPSSRYTDKTVTSATLCFGSAFRPTVFQRIAWGPSSEPPASVRPQGRGLGGWLQLSGLRNCHTTRPALELQRPLPSVTHRDLCRHLRSSNWRASVLPHDMVAGLQKRFSYLARMGPHWVRSQLMRPPRAGTQKLLLLHCF